MVRFRVLLVDDEVVFTESMSKLLRTREYQVTTANDGKSAIQALEEHEFDVVVLDLRMPKMDGIATLKEIGKMGLFVEVLILTGCGSVDTALEAVKLGAYDYLTKPCEIDELVEKIESARKEKEASQIKDMANRIQRVVASPREALHLFPQKKREWTGH